MFVVLLKFSHNKTQAGQFIEGHREWIQRGFAEGVFLLAGSLEPDLGGAVLAHGTSLADLRSRVEGDPFVAHQVVSADILQIDAAKVDDRLGFLLDG